MVTLAVTSQWRCCGAPRSTPPAAVGAVAALFVTCQLPQLVLRVILLLLRRSTDLQLNEWLTQQAINVASGLLVVHASATFFVYCAVGRTFRRVLLRLISCGLAGSRVASSAERNEAAEALKFRLTIKSA